MTRPRYTVAAADVMVLPAAFAFAVGSRYRFTPREVVQADTWPDVEEHLDALAMTYKGQVSLGRAYLAVGAQDHTTGELVARRLYSDGRLVWRADA